MRLKLKTSARFGCQLCHSTRLLWVRTGRSSWRCWRQLLARQNGPSALSTRKRLRRACTHKWKCLPTTPRLKSRWGMPRTRSPRSLGHACCTHLICGWRRRRSGHCWACFKKTRPWPALCVAKIVSRGNRFICPWPFFSAKVRCVWRGGFFFHAWRSNFFFFYTVARRNFTPQQKVVPTQKSSLVWHTVQTEVPLETADLTKEQMRYVFFCFFLLFFFLCGGFFVFFFIISNALFFNKVSYFYILFFSFSIGYFVSDSKDWLLFFCAVTFDFLGKLRVYC